MKRHMERPHGEAYPSIAKLISWKCRAYFCFGEH